VLPVSFAVICAYTQTQGPGSLGVMLTPYQSRRLGFVQQNRSGSGDGCNLGLVVPAD